MISLQAASWTLEHDLIELFYLIIEFMSDFPYSGSALADSIQPVELVTVIQGHHGSWTLVYESV